jgi:iron(III) transport system permease protein
MPQARRILPAPDAFSGLALFAAAAAAAPVLALAVIAARGGGEAWAHLAANVLPRATLETGLLAAGVAAFVLIVGTGAAWLVSTHDFPGRRTAETALLLPLAFPAYVLAFTWLDLMHPVGPIPSAIRALLGYAKPSDLRLGDPRSLPGAILIFGLALYPYVYIAARAVFLSQAARLTEAARMLGAGRAEVFFRVALPLARPALAAGAALAIMETLNDIGAAEFLSVNTLTLSVYSTWINRSDLPGAAQIALVMLALVLSLVLIERAARGGRSYAVVGRNARRLAVRRTGGLAGAGLFALAMAPALFGFIIPAAHLLWQAARRVGFSGLPGELLAEIGNTVLVSAAATLAAVGGAVMVVGGRRLFPGERLRGVLARIATIGYAAPGTVLAIGLLAVFGTLDAGLRAAASALGLKPPGLLFSASTAAVASALAIRFFRLATSKIETGLERLSPSLDQAARTLGRSPRAVLREVHLPLLRPSLAGAALLVFVDCMKELPATLLLRPMNFETLATHVYGEAARGTYENGALAACLIVAVGLLPVMLLTRVGREPPERRAGPGDET